MVLDEAFRREALVGLFAVPAAVEGVDPLERTTKGSFVPADEAGEP